MTENFENNIIGGNTEEPKDYVKLKPVKNKVAVIFNVIGIVIFVSGFIIGAVLGIFTASAGNLISSSYAASGANSGVNFNISDFLSGAGFAVALLYWIGSFIIGMLCLGYAQIIQLLTDIKHK